LAKEWVEGDGWLLIGGLVYKLRYLLTVYQILLLMTMSNPSALFPHVIVKPSKEHHILRDPASPLIDEINFPEAFDCLGCREPGAACHVPSRGFVDLTR